MRKLQKFDARDGNPRPQLKPEWKDFLDYGDDRALDLRDTHQITFSNFDYARLEIGDLRIGPTNLPTLPILWPLMQKGSGS